jgi:hypothetical protein
MDSQQGQVQRLAVSDRARRDQSLHTVVEGDQRLADAGDEGGFEQLDEEPGDVVDMESPVRPAPLPADDCRIAAGRFTG